MKVKYGRFFYEDTTVAVELILWIPSFFDISENKNSIKKELPIISNKGKMLIYECGKLCGWKLRDWFHFDIPLYLLKHCEARGAVMNVEQSKRILLVDDEPVIAIGEAEKIREHGFRVETVYSGKQALELMTGNAGYDLILMDIDLGGTVDGTETARKILDEREVPLIFLTGHDEPEVVL